MAMDYLFILQYEKIQYDEALQTPLLGMCHDGIPHCMS